MPTYADIRTAIAAFDLAHDAYVAAPSEETRCLREEAAALVIFRARQVVGLTLREAAEKVAGEMKAQGLNIALTTEPPPTDPMPLAEPEPIAPEEPAAPARRGRIRAAYKDINARGKGTITYRMAALGDTLVWIDQHPDCVSDGRRLSPDNVRAGGRKDTTFVEAPEGLLILEIIKGVGGEPGPRYSVCRSAWSEKKGGMVVLEDGCGHVGVRRGPSGFVHVIEVDGVRRELTSS